MPQIENQENLKNPSLNVRRGEILYREDIKTSFAYAIVGVSVIAVLASVGYLAIVQLKK
ncbi:hypothetical protein [endosymbiont GvMRE of Glomus versiforme]|jgi:hypothetical protein|uniref:hypothetical protein n=1 Tax=endosymbiont GvMRE of Glomus versiforme TaxID=2039283 RepID=UPI000EB96F06|nr:hypothetical protein [endosymbiont GvMRE of Glomus versiforme]RHZ36605.1 hypothetical protein GvMRE_I2g558 [endosymbiont GvMRE of Glomus versiforme]RHZ36670.1 hypothetical protein GvMRE_I2g407 [endosymbiont GvMRE of Glomus versiforme]RHZ37377.1 hypothetical protein GvMRE_I1g724 [endosymbiont GvMRE of Glomus versiforme]